MNDYVPFPGEQSLLPPGKFEDTHFYYFVLGAEKERLQELCDRYLNRPSGGALAYKPLGVVLLAFSHMERLTSADSARGFIRYKDIACWVPVLGGQTRPLCLFPPFIFVDDAATLVTGREVYGLPKQLGRFQMPLTPAEIGKFDAPQFRAEVVGTLYPGGPNDWRTLLTIEHIGPKASLDEERLRAAIKSLVAPSLATELDLPRWLSEPFAVPCVGLKQFRDARRPSSACYREVVEAPLRVHAIRPTVEFFHHAFKLTLMDVPSHPVVQTLGLQPGETIVPLTAYFEATMHMDPGEVVGGHDAR